MNFGLAIELSVDIRQKGNVIQSLSDDLKDYFANRQYGPDIKNYTIGVVCLSTKFDEFYKMGVKPKYTKGIKVIKPDGILFTLEDNYEYTIKIDYESFKVADDTASKKILAKEILGSLVVFEKMRSNIKDFDMIDFKADLENYFRSENLI